MEPVRKDDFEKIEAVATEFVKNVLSMSGKSKDEAKEAFRQNADLMTKVKMISTTVRYNLTDAENYDRRTELLVRNCELALPVLVKVYGRPLLEQAMKATSGRSLPVAKRVRFMGGFEVGTLIRKSLPPTHHWD